MLANFAANCFHHCVSRIIVITGTDTGVGKTWLTARLAHHLRRQGVRVAALKPLCSGGREDARALHEALDGALTLDEINPWFFRAPLTPLLAARMEKRSVRWREVVAQVRCIAKRFDVVLVEGAGGLLSPLGEDFSTRELIRALDADVLIAAPNRLGVVNHLRLTLEALPPSFADRARGALMSPQKADAASHTNPPLLAEFIEQSQVIQFPFRAHTKISPPLRRALDALLRGTVELRRTRANRFR